MQTTTVFILALYFSIGYILYIVKGLSTKPYKKPMVGKLNVGVLCLYIALLLWGGLYFISHK